MDYAHSYIVKKELKDLHRLLDSLLSEKNNIKLLEAGSGSSNYIRLNNKDVYKVGIDISEKQLQANTYLDKKILGDIQHYDFSGEKFDLVICWNVLEHLLNPRKALDNFIKALKRGGLLVIAVPNIFSFKGIITKYTPFKLHSAFFKLLYRGKVYADPFPTFLHLAISPTSLKKFAHKNGLRIKYFRLFEGNVQMNLRSKSRIFDILFHIIGLAVTIISFRKFDPNMTDLIIVMQQT